MSNQRSPTQYKGVRAIAPPDLTIAKISPPAGFKPTVKGQLYLDIVGLAAWMWSGTTWIALGTGAVGGIVTLTGDSGGAVSPVGGNIDVVGDITDGASVVGTAGTLTINIAPASTTQRGTLETATTAEAIAGSSAIVAVAPNGLQAKLGTQTAHGVAMGNTGPTAALSWSAAGTSGQAFISGGAAADGAYGTLGVVGGGTGLATLTIHALYVGNGTSAPTALAVGSTGQTLMGSTAADPGWTSSPSFAGSVTAATTITGTLGDITASNGNFVSSTSGKGIVLTSAQASGVAASPVVVNGRSGRATFTTVSIAAAADLTLTITNSAITASTTEVMLSMSGATTGSALSIKSKTASAGSLAIVVTNGTGATTTTADIQIDFLVLNA